MRYIGAYLLAVLGGNANPDAAAIKAILAAQDVSVDAALLDKLISELSGKNIEELIEAGKKKLATVAVAGPAPAAASSAPAAAAKEEKKEEKKKDDEDDDAGGMSLDLFGDDGY